MIPNIWHIFKSFFRYYPNTVFAPSSHSIKTFGPVIQGDQAPPFGLLPILG